MHAVSTREFLLQGLCEFTLMSCDKDESDACLLSDTYYIYMATTYWTKTSPVKNIYPVTESYYTLQWALHGSTTNYYCISKIIHKSCI